MNLLRQTKRCHRKNRRRQSRRRCQPTAEAKSSPRDELDDMGDAVPARRLQDAIDPLLEPVIDAIRTRGLADALADLPALYREMDDSR